MTYISRVVDSELNSALQALGGVVIEGPKACGKTATGLQWAASSVRLDIDPGARELATVDPSLLLTGATPRLIDEWQIEPVIWNHLRAAIDERQKSGQFILAGSAVPADDVTRHSGAGRIARLRMRPMSLFESGHSTAEISLTSIMKSEPPRSQKQPLTIEQLVERMCVGGWPGIQEQSLENALAFGRSYVGEVVRTDISQIDSIRRDPQRVMRLMQSLARNVSTEVPLKKLVADAAGADGTLNSETAREYLAALERIMIVENQEAWSVHLRSRAGLRSSSKRHFVDPSLAVATLAASPQMLLRDAKFLGFLFESLVVRDLRIYAQALGGHVFHYRDNTGLEVDTVVQLADGRWAAFEVKLGESKVDDGAANLLKLIGKVDSDQSGKPAMLGVITGGRYGYMRPDGVAVIPLAALAP